MPDFHRIRALVHTYGDLFGDLGDLLRKELRLGEVELKLGLANLTQAAVLFVASGMIALFAVLLLLLGIVHLIASFGLAFALVLHACGARIADYRRNHLLHGAREGERRQPCSEASFRSAGQNSTHAEEYVFVTLDRRNPESCRCKSAFAGPRFLLVVSTSLLTLHYVHSRALGEPSAFFPA